jgi:hypothetical protein
MRDVTPGIRQIDPAEIGSAPRPRPEHATIAGNGLDPSLQEITDVMCPGRNTAQRKCNRHGGALLQHIELLPQTIMF